MDPKSSKLLNRKTFFKALMGEFISFYDEAKGRKQVPLNRIQELPESMISEIKPVMFDNPEWVIKDNRLFHLNKTDKKYYIHKEFSATESFIIQYFDKNHSLSEISSKLSADKRIEVKDAYKQVKDLFFEMLSQFVCHPQEQYDFDKIAKQETEKLITRPDENQKT